MEVGRFGALASLNEAWTRLKGARRVFVYMTLTVAIISWLVGTALAGVLPPAPVETVTLSTGEVVQLGSVSTSTTVRVLGGLSLPIGGDTAYPWLEQLVNGALSALFAGAFAAYALRRAVGLDVRYTMLVEYFRFFPTFFLLAVAAFLAISLAATLGVVVVTVVTIVGGVAFAFTQLFIVDREANLLEALGGSWQVVKANLGQVVLLLVIGALLSAVLSLPVFFASPLPTAINIAFTVAFTLASVLLTALMSIALACAFRDAVGIHNAGSDVPVDTQLRRTALNGGD